MDRVKISEIASEAAKTSKEILAACKELGILAKAAGSSVAMDEAEKLMSYIMGNALAPKESKKTTRSKKNTATKADTKPSKSTQKVSTSEKNKKIKKEKTIEPKQNSGIKTISSSGNIRKVGIKKVEVVRTVQKVLKTDENQTEGKTAIETARKKTGTGLRVVRKKRVETPIRKEYKKPKLKENKKSEASKNAALEALEMLKTQSISEASTKKTKRKTTTPVSKKSSGEKINILASQISMESRYDDDENDVVLPDLTVPNIKIEEKTQLKKKNVFSGPQTQHRQPNRGGGIASIGRKRGKKRRPKQSVENSEKLSVIEIPEDARVYEFAEAINLSISEVIKALFNLGIMATKNDFLDADQIEILSEEFEVEVKTKNELDELDYIGEYDEENEAKGESRPPIVTIMGHVDHGKTSLLDYIRSTKVTDAEAGGITQHVGAYTIERNNKKITFIDTPGHAAFSEMRARGADVTDVVIIVVSADDGIMPQTKEAINHAKAAKVPMIFAINKIDKPSANIDMVKSGLAEAGCTTTDWGGEYDAIGVSAKTGEGIEDLLETVLTHAELLELEANSNAPAKAAVIESSLEKGRGAVATIIIQNGTLQIGDSVIVGNSYGRVRAIANDMGKRIKKLGLSEAGEIQGLDSVPKAGDILITAENEKEAREIANKRRDIARQKELSKSTKATLDDLHALIAEGNLKRLPVILKADVGGTLQALESSLEKLRNEEVKVHIVHSAVGAITESDVVLAAASENTIILGFNVKPSQSVKNKAKELGVEIRTYDVIYALMEDIETTLGGMLSPLTENETIGSVEVREVYKIPSIGTIAGCMVTDGKVERNSFVNVVRGEETIFSGKLSSLKRFKDDVKEVGKGYECGIGVEGFDDLQRGDQLEIFKEIKVQATFEA